MCIFVRKNAKETGETKDNMFNTGNFDKNLSRNYSILHGKKNQI